MFTGFSLVGTNLDSKVGRLRSAVAAGLILLVACQPLQAGSEDLAVQAADHFLHLLKGQRAAEAWALLTPETQHAAYEDSFDRFEGDVSSASWSEFSWDFGTVVNHDISWGVHVVTDDANIWHFLVRSGIAGRWADGIVLLVQFDQDGEYFVAGQGLDEDLRD